MIGPLQLAKSRWVAHQRQAAECCHATRSGTAMEGHFGLQAGKQRRACSRPFRPQKASSSGYAVEAPKRMLTDAVATRPPAACMHSKPEMLHDSTSDMGQLQRLCPSADVPQPQFPPRTCSECAQTGERASHLPGTCARPGCRAGTWRHASRPCSYQPKPLGAAPACRMTGN